MPTGLRFRALLPARGAAEVCQRPQDLRRQQCQQAAERSPATPAGGRCELARLRGRGEDERPCLRLRRCHLHPPKASHQAPERTRRHQCGSHPLCLQ